MLRIASLKWEQNKQSQQTDNKWVRSKMTELINDKMNLKINKHVILLIISILNSSQYVICFKTES